MPVTLAAAEVPVSVLARWREADAEYLAVPHAIGTLADAAWTAAVASRHDCDLVILDGYCFDAAYQRAVRNSQSTLILLDDLATAHEYAADVIVNQNAHANREMYGVRTGKSRLLLGNRYALLRWEFNDRPRPPRPVPERAQRLLLTFGGSDPCGYTTLTLRALHQCQQPFSEVRALVSSVDVHLPEIRAAAEQLTSRTYIVTDCERPSDAMAGCDLAVSAAGSTSWELAFMGVPFLAMRAAANQVLVARNLQGRGIALDLGAASEITEQSLAQGIGNLAADRGRRTQMSASGQELVDGQGAWRVLQELGLTRLRLDFALDDDLNWLYQLANDDVVRQGSFRAGPISWGEHVRWFRSRLHSQAHRIWIARNVKDSRAGVVRFEPDSSGRIQVGLAVNADERGQGLGREMLSLALRKAARWIPGVAIHALIKPQNAVSLKVFESCGFSRSGEEMIEGCRALHYVYND